MLDRSDWFGVLKEAESEFYVAGHSMGLWCSPSNGEEFARELLRILKGGGTVTLVMLGLDSEPLRRLGRATGVDYSLRVTESLQVLGSLAADLDEDEHGRLEALTLQDDLSTPYMVVGNERRLIAGSYMAMSKNATSLCVELERESRSACAIYDDFHKLAREGCCKSPLVAGAQGGEGSPPRMA